MKLWIYVGLPLLLSLNMHPLHLGLTTIEVNDSINNAEILFKLDKESLKYAFSHYYLYDLNFEKESLNEKDNTFINEYINTHFLLKLNGEKVNMKLNRHSYEENDVFFYYTAEINSIIDSVLVRNLLLLDVNLYQTNVLIFKNGNIEKNFILDKDENSVVFSLKEQ